jgi:hypothetical protein
MKYAAEMGSGAMIQITKFYEDWFWHSQVGKGSFSYRQKGDLISLITFLQANESSVAVQPGFELRLRPGTYTWL